MSLKFSLRDLLLLIAILSVACAALANSGIWWHSIIVTSTLSGMTGLLIWGTLHSGTRRAFACGWLLFGVGYLAIVFGPWTGNNLGANMITARGLAHLELKALGDNPSPSVLSFHRDVPSDYNVSNTIDLSLNNAVWTSYPSTGWANVFDPSWVTTFTTFQSTGHWLLASVFGYCGAHLAAFLFLRRQAAKD